MKLLWLVVEVFLKLFIIGIASKVNSACADPFCTPLIAQTLGPMNGTVSFTVNLRPNLSSGTYDLVRRIDIDPQGVWINYGQDKIGTVNVLQPNLNSIIDLRKISETFAELSLVSNEPKADKKQESSPAENTPKVSAPAQSGQATPQGAEQPSIVSGLLTSAKGKLSERGIIIITGMIVALLALVVVSRTVVELKKHRY